MIDNCTKRVIAVHVKDAAELSRAIDASTTAFQCGLGEVVLFCPNGLNLDEVVNEVIKVEFPIEIDTSPKQKNFIIDWCKSNKFNGFLHMIETSVKPNSKTKSYIEKLETTMSALDYDVHLSTATDRCNYVFNKFCPRIALNVDDEMIKNKMSLPDSLCFTSHSNVSYVTFNFSALRNDVPKFDERFTVGMFFIIEFLARRKATKRDDQLYYMNQYLSISDEIGGYDILEDIPSENDNARMQQENEVFKSLAIDYTPDNNIDIVLDALYKKLKSRI